MYVVGYTTKLWVDNFVDIDCMNVFIIAQILFIGEAVQIFQSHSNSDSLIQGFPSGSGQQ